MIIPFRWWHQEHPIKNIENASQWGFEHASCINHDEDEEIADVFEWDETVAFDENATTIGRIGATKQRRLSWMGCQKSIGNTKTYLRT